MSDRIESDEPRCCRKLDMLPMLPTLPWCCRTGPPLPDTTLRSDAISDVLLPPRESNDGLRGSGCATVAGADIDVWTGEGTGRGDDATRAACEGDDVMAERERGEVGAGVEAVSAECDS